MQRLPTVDSIRKLITGTDTAYHISCVGVTLSTLSHLTGQTVEMASTLLSTVFSKSVADNGEMPLSLMSSDIVQVSQVKSSLVPDDIHALPPIRLEISAIGTAEWGHVTDKSGSQHGPMYGGKAPHGKSYYPLPKSWISQKAISLSTEILRSLQKDHLINGDTWTPILQHSPRRSSIQNLIKHRTMGENHLMTSEPPSQQSTIISCRAFSSIR